jgi:hydrogenase nickel incorporation protein HypB
MRSIIWARRGSVLFIENVGNLVCPAAFDLGEGARVAILSVTEGEDKPLKYPDMFASADLVLVNKVDLLPYLDFDVEAAIANARRVNPRVRVLKVRPAAARGWGLARLAARRAGHGAGRPRAGGGLIPMCLAIPARIEELLDDEMARVSAGG